MVKFAEAETFGQILKALRKSRGLSQAGLADKTATTTRNISNLETGRNTPTRSMVKRLAQAIDANAQAYSELLRAAGYVYDHYNEEEAEEYQKAVQQAVDLALQKHAPYPALALNRRYEIIAMNESLHEAMAFLWGDRYQPLPLPVSIFDILLSEAFQQAFTEAEDYTRFLIQRVHREQLNNINSADLIEELKAKFTAIPKSWWELDANYQPSPCLETEMYIRGENYKAMGVVHSIGSPHDFGGNTVRVIFSYPTNAETQSLFETFEKGIKLVSQ